MRQPVELYESLLRQLPVGLSVWHLEDPGDARTFRLVSANPVIEEFSIGPVETLYGKTFTEIFPRANGTRWPELFREVLDAGEPREFGQLPYDEQASRDRSFWVQVCPLPNHCVGVVFEDLTKKHSASTIIASQAQLLDLATDAILVRALDGRITYWNQGAERLYGWPKAEVIGQAGFDVLRTVLPVPFKEVTGILLRDGHWEGELLHTRRDGTVVTVASRWTLQRDATGAPVGWLQINTDITERKRIERALRESEEGLRLLIDGVQDYAIFRLDPEGRVLSWNAGAQRIKGYTTDEIVGKDLAIFYPPEDAAAGKPKHALQIAAEQGRFEGEGWRVRKDGSRFWAHVVISPMHDKAGQLRGFAKVTRDITELREVERVRQEAQALERRADEITLLSQLGGLLHACLTPEEAFSLAGKFAPQLFPDASGALCVVSPSRNAVEAVTTWGDVSSGEAVFAPTDCWALRTGRPHYVDDPESVLLCRHLTRWPSMAHLCVPMTAQGDTLGVLHLFTRSHSASPSETVRSITAAKQQLALTVAEQVGLALANLRWRETLTLQSIRDSLTGLFNRRYLQESLDRELRRAARSSKTLGAILLDIDHFKHFNDAFGHDAGDIVLRELGNFLQAQVRGGDIACRFGGEEFMLVLPDTSLEVTLQRAEQLREAIKRVSLQFGGQPLGMITFSLGVAMFPAHGTTCDDILRAADEALYRAKGEGRDRVVVARSLRAVGREGQSIA